MSEKATFCPRCLHMHVGVCTVKAAKAPPAKVVAPKPGNAPAADQKFDRKAYQRELMRKRRADAKAAKP